MYDERGLVERAIQSGAKGYLLKERAAVDIIRAIYEVYKGGYAFCPKVAKYIVNGFLTKKYQNKSYQKSSKLTTREREILQLIAEGFSNKEIATQLTLSLHTVHVHRKNIMSKLDIHRQADLIRYALKKGISQL